MSLLIWTNAIIFLCFFYLFPYFGLRVCHKLLQFKLSFTQLIVGTRERRCSAPGGCAGSRSPSSKCECSAECGCNAEASDGAQSDDLDFDYSDSESDLNYLAREKEEFSQVRRIRVCVDQNRFSKRMFN